MAESDAANNIKTMREGSDMLDEATKMRKTIIQRKYIRASRDLRSDVEGHLTLIGLEQAHESAFELQHT